MDRMCQVKPGQLGREVWSQTRALGVCSLLPAAPGRVWGAPQALEEHVAHIITTGDDKCQDP